MKYQVEEKRGKWIIVQTEEPFQQVGRDYNDKKTADDQLRRLLQEKK
jgi:hypothetical protein